MNESTMIDLAAVIIPALLLLALTRYSMVRGDEKERQQGGNPDAVPGCARAGCLWLPALALGAVLLVGMLRAGGAR